MELSGLLVAVSLGFGAGAGFGPVNVEFTRVCLDCHRTCVKFAIVAVCIDAALLTATVFGAAALADNDIVIWLCPIGGGVIGIIGIHSLLRSRSVAGLGKVESDTWSMRRAIAIAMSNPVAVTLWSSIGVTLQELGGSNRISSIIAAMIGDVIWFASWGWIIWFVGRRVSVQTVALINRLSACILVLAAIMAISTCRWSLIT